MRVRRVRVREGLYLLFVSFDNYTALVCEFNVSFCCYLQLDIDRGVGTRDMSPRELL